MSQHYIFHELGSIPGIPGSFSYCHVDIDDEGNIEVRSFAQHPAFAATPDTVAPAESLGTPTEPLVEPTAAPAKSTPDIVQEQAQPAPVPYFTGG
jgi:hypothetical protein